jgi:hypothetical protein
VGVLRKERMNMADKIQHEGGWFQRPEEASLIYISPGFYSEEELNELWHHPRYKISLSSFSHLIDYIHKNCPHLLAIIGPKTEELTKIIDKQFEQQKQMLDVIQVLSSGEPLKK